MKNNNSSNQLQHQGYNKKVHDATNVNSNIKRKNQHKKF